VVKKRLAGYPIFSMKFEVPVPIFFLPRGVPTTSLVCSWVEIPGTKDAGLPLHLLSFAHSGRKGIFCAGVSCHNARKIPFYTLGILGGSLFFQGFLEEVPTHSQPVELRTSVSSDPLGDAHGFPAPASRVLSHWPTNL